MPANADNLARRLAALKLTGSKITPNHSSVPNNKNTITPLNPDDLTARFKSLFPSTTGSALSPLSTSAADPEETRIEEQLLGSLALGGDGCDFNITSADEHEIEALLAEAEKELKAAAASPEWLDTRAEDQFPEWIRDDGIGGDEGEADELVRRVIDEVSLEKRQGISVDDDQKEEEDVGREENMEPIADQDAKKEDDELSKLLARFQELGGGGSSGRSGGLELPAAPSSAPGKPRLIAAVKGLEEIDTWCCICNEDAEYRCSGCDGDIYCKECLYEAHVGPNAGWEEKRHKWTKYVRPKKILSSA